LIFVSFLDQKHKHPSKSVSLKQLTKQADHVLPEEGLNVKLNFEQFKPQ